MKGRFALLRGLGLLCLTLSLCRGNAWAFAGAEGASFLDVPVGAGPASLGGAYSTLATNAYAPVWNPAGLGFLDSTQVAAMHQTYIDQTYFEFLSFVHPITPGHAFGISAQYFRPSDMDGTDLSGNDIGKVSGYYGAYSLAYGQLLTDNWSIGLTGKIIQAAIDGVSASAYAGDAGTLYRVTRRLSLAAVIVNVGSKLKFLEQGDPLPLAVRAGGSYQLTNDIRISAEGVHPQNGQDSLHVGVEWPSEEQRGFCVRTGYSTDRIRELGALAGVSVGFAVPLWGQEISYAFSPAGSLGASHYLSLIFRFGRKANEAPVMTTDQYQQLDPAKKDQDPMLNDSNKQFFEN